MKNFFRQLRPALFALVVFTVVCGVVYPLVVTAVAQVALKDEAEGSLIKVDGEVVGSKLIGQQFVSPQYFHPRPSAAGDGYNAGASSGSNLGPHNPALLDAVAERVVAYRAENGLSDDVLVPVDAVTASASGLDPHISVANARLQAPRVAEARGLEIAVVLQMIGDHTDDRDLLVLGDPGVNVLELNIALDAFASS
ncbi:MAG: K(+)-transporting ATPase subunit C [Ilumatobacteraceae bacterium]